MIHLHTLFRMSVNKLAIPLPGTNYLHNSFHYGGAVFWNGVRHEGSLNTFIFN